jgi:hypothetical protein
VPFTCSHPAAVLPFLRGRFLVPSALIIGSMAPDFQYFMLLSLQTDRSWHDPHGGILYCIPAGLLVLWCYHRILKQPLLSLLPRAHRLRLCAHAGAFEFLPARRLAQIVGSLAVGAMTHVAWDSVTHVYGWYGEPYRWLSTVVFSTPYGVIRIHDVTQALSTVIGAAALAAAYWRWFRRAPLQREAVESGSWVYPLAIVGAIGAGAGLAALFAVADLLPRLLAMPDISILRFAGGRAIVVAISFVGAECLVFSLGWHWRQLATATAAAPSRRAGSPGASG